MFNSKKTVESIVSEKIIAQLGENPMQWVKTWRPARSNGHPHMPMYNYRTGYGYNLINCLLLEEVGAYVSAADLFDLGGHVIVDGKPIAMASRNYFPKQAKDLVRIGIRSFRKRAVVEDSEGNPILDEDGKPKVREWTRHNYYYCINTKYTDLPEKKRKDEEENVSAFPAGSDAIDNARKLAEAYHFSGGPEVTFNGNVSAYIPALDEVTIPKPTQFKDIASYYATLFHEFGHSTGSNKRLGRDLSGTFGTKQYAKEELIAELFSAMCMAACGLDNNDTQINSTAYIQNWSEVLSKDPSIIFSACSSAEYAFGYVFDMLPEQAAETAAVVTVPEAETVESISDSNYIEKYKNAYENIDNENMIIEGDDPTTGSHVWFSLNMGAVLCLPANDFRKAWKSISPFMTELQKEAVYALANKEWPSRFLPEMEKCKAIIKPAKKNKDFRSALRSMCAKARKEVKDFSVWFGIANGKLIAWTTTACIETSLDDWPEARDMYPKLPEKLEHAIGFIPASGSVREVDDDLAVKVQAYLNGNHVTEFKLATQTDKDLENKRIRYSFPEFGEDYGMDKDLEAIAKRIGDIYFVRTYGLPVLHADGKGMRYIAMPMRIE